VGRLRRKTRRPLDPRMIDQPAAPASETENQAFRRGACTVAFRPAIPALARARPTEGMASPVQRFLRYLCLDDRQGPSRRARSEHPQPPT